MEKHMKFIVTFVFISLAGVAAWNFEEFVIKKDFIVFAHTKCDPVVESCFVMSCHEGDPDCNQDPYKKISKHASNIATCSTPGDCPPIECAPGEVDCTATLCSSEALEEGEVCAQNVRTILSGAPSEEEQEPINATSTTTQ